MAKAEKISPEQRKLDQKFDAKMELRLGNVLGALGRISAMGRGQWTHVTEHSTKYRAVIGAVQEQIKALLSTKKATGGMADIYARFGKGVSSEEEEEEENGDEDDEE